MSRGVALMLSEPSHGMQTRPVTTAVSQFATQPMCHFETHRSVTRRIPRSHGANSAIVRAIMGLGDMHGATHEQSACHSGSDAVELHFDDQAQHRHTGLQHHDVLPSDEHYGDVMKLNDE